MRYRRRLIHSPRASRRPRSTPSNFASRPASFPLRRIRTCERPDCPADLSVITRLARGRCADLDGSSGPLPVRRHGAGTPRMGSDAPTGLRRQQPCIRDAPLTVLHRDTSHRASSSSGKRYAGPWLLVATQVRSRIGVTEPGARPTTSSTVQSRDLVVVSPSPLC